MIPTIQWKNGAVTMIEQTLLPTRRKNIIVRTADEMWDAIKRLAVRGAPAIGVAAAYGAYLGVRKTKAKTWAQFRKDLKQTTDYLATSRPTAVNLFWALDRMTACAEAHRDEPVPRILQ
ncbi:MAG: S-methyl-5-thioribose-1-phosphate isomerase, partial [Planctomycetota bacterium]